MLRTNKIFLMMFDITLFTMDITKLLNNPNIKQMMDSMEGSDIDGFSITDVIENPHFQSVVENISGSLGVEKTDDIYSIVKSPDFAGDIMDMAGKLDIDNILETAGGIFGMDHTKLNDIKSSITSAKNGLNDMMNAPSDISVKVTITQSDAYRGIRKKMSVKRLRYDDKSNTFMQEKQRLALNIPPGTRSGNIITVDDEGDEYMNSQNELIRTNLNIEINVTVNDTYQLIGNDFYYKLDVPYEDFHKDMYYTVKFLDDEDIILFKPQTFRPINRLIGTIDNLGMIPDTTAMLSHETNDTDTPHDIGKLFILFNLCWKTGNESKPYMIHTVSTPQGGGCDDSSPQGGGCDDSTPEGGECDDSSPQGGGCDDSTPEGDGCVYEIHELCVGRGELNYIIQNSR